MYHKLVHLIEAYCSDSDETVRKGACCWRLLEVLVEISFSFFFFCSLLNSSTNVVSFHVPPIKKKIILKALVFSSFVPVILLFFYFYYLFISFNVIRIFCVYCKLTIAISIWSSRNLRISVCIQEIKGSSK